MAVCGIMQVEKVVSRPKKASYGNICYTSGTYISIFLKAQGTGMLLTQFAIHHQADLVSYHRSCHLPVPQF